MYIYMYIYITYTGMSVCVHVCIYIYMYICVYMHIMYIHILLPLLVVHCVQCLSTRLIHVLDVITKNKAHVPADKREILCIRMLHALTRSHTDTRTHMH